MREIATPQPHEVVVQTDGLYRAVIDAWHAVEKEFDVHWEARNPIQGEATYKVFAYRIALATVQRLIAEGWRDIGCLEAEPPGGTPKTATK